MVAISKFNPQINDSSKNLSFYVFIAKENENNKPNLYEVMDYYYVVILNGYKITSLTPYVISVNRMISPWFNTFWLILILCLIAKNTVLTFLTFTVSNSGYHR